MDIVTYNKKPLFAVCACVFFYTYFFNQHAGVKRIAAHSSQRVTGGSRSHCGIYIMVNYCV